MKKLEQFQCEFCKTIYNDNLTAENCEKNHKKAVSVKNVRYLPFKNDKSGYPLILEVTMDNGETVLYKKR